MPYPGSSKEEVVAKVMRRYKEGKLKSGSGKAKSHKQALAIALSEARKYGR